VRIVHLDGERGFRGGERQLLYLAAALRERGHENVVACRQGEDLAEESRRQGFETLELPYFAEFDPFTALPLLRARPDVLHAHTAHGAGVAALARTLGKLPVVAHRRVDFHLRSGFSRRVKYEAAGRVIAVSEAIAGILVEDGLARARIAVVPDGLPVSPEEARWAGVDSERFALPSPQQRRDLREVLAKEHGVSAAAPWVFNAAALVPHKDHATLLAAAVLVLLKRKDAVFLIAGKGPEQASLAASIERMGLRGKVLLLGQLEDPIGLLKACDCFALSSWGEGMGSVLLEAAACGAPIAATTAGGIPEVVTHGRTGLLCPPREPEALADVILRQLEDPEHARKLAQAARQDLPRFGLSRMAGQMEEIYDAVA
jgi:glycosyltransferase involved in cell wall biosynthesis